MDTYNSKQQKTILALAVFIFVLVLLLGAGFYKYLFDLDYLDAFYSAAVTLSTLELTQEEMIETKAQKIFVMIYSLVAGVIFIAISARAIEGIFVLYSQDLIPF